MKGSPIKILHHFFFNRPLCSTDADGRRYFASATCGGKNSQSRLSGIMITFMPERHAKLLPGQVVQAKKSLLSAFCLRMSAVKYISLITKNRCKMPMFSNDHIYNLLMTKNALIY